MLLGVENGTLVEFGGWLSAIERLPMVEGGTSTDGHGVAVGVGAIVGIATEVGVGVALTLGEGDCVGIMGMVGVGTGLISGVAMGLGEGSAAGSGVGLGAGERVGCGVGKGELIGSAVGVGVALTPFTQKSEWVGFRSTKVPENWRGSVKLFMPLRKEAIDRVARPADFISLGIKSAGTKR